MPINIDDTTIIKSLFSFFTLVLGAFGGLLVYVYRQFVGSFDKHCEAADKERTEIREEIERTEKRLAAENMENTENLRLLRAENRDDHIRLFNGLEKKKDKE